MPEDVENLDPETLVRLGCIETLNQGDIEKTDEFYTSDATYNRSDEDQLALEDLKQDATDFRAAFPDIEATIHEVIETDDEVSFRYTVRGTQEEQFRDLPSTGESFETQGIGFARLEDGLIAEYSLVFDRLGMLDQLGIVG